jgi:hypothetical protein
MITNFAHFRKIVFAHDGKEIISNYGVEIPASRLLPADTCSFAAVNNRLMIAAGNTNKVWTTDVLTHRETTATTSAGFVLQAKCLANHRGILYAGNLVEADGAHKNRIRWSAFGEPENFTPWGASNYQNFEDVGDPEEEIVAMASWGNNLYIFKEDTIWVAIGIATDFVGPEIMKQINSRFGLVGANAVCTYHDGVRFLSEGGIYLIKDLNFQSVYPELWPYLSERDKSYWYRASMDIFPETDELVLLVPGDNEFKNDCFVRSSTKQWGQWSWPSRSMTVVKAVVNSEGTPLLMFGDEWDGVYRFDKNKRNDFETEEWLESAWDTGWTSLLNKTEAKKKLARSIEPIIRQEGDFLMQVEVYFDMNLVPSQTKWLTMKSDAIVTDAGVTDRSSTASYDNYIQHFLDINGSAKWIRIVFKTPGDNNRFKLLSAAIGCIEKGGI